MIVSHNYVKDPGDLVVVVLVDVDSETSTLTAEWLYIHDGSPDEINLVSDDGKHIYQTDVSKLKKFTSTVYTGEIKLNVKFQIAANSY